ncbi:unnamed protein product [Callosobruchus maculatus]|nr:unnamed protein product [Callosobruchus maculatus]
MGTNLFFDTEDNTEEGDAFCKKACIKAKVILKQTKVLNLKPVKVCHKKIDTEPEVKKITFNFKWDYKTLLDKLEDGTLRLHDITMTTGAETDLKSNESQSANKTAIKDDDGNVLKDAAKGEDIQEPQNGKAKRHEVTEMEVTDIPDKESYKGIQMEVTDIPDKEGHKGVQMEVTDIPDKEGYKEFQSNRKVQILEAEYEKLRVLAWRPTRREAEDELIQECDSQYKASYEYHNIERQILKPCDAFKTEPVSNIDEATWSNCVDIDRCVFYSILTPSSDFPRKLTPEEQKKVLRLENFDNLSLSARYCVIKEQVELLEKSFDKISDHELSVKDEFGRTPKETLEIYRKLKQTLRRRIEEIIYANLN